MGLCGGCDKAVAECVCGKCSKCAQRVDKCVCVCPSCNKVVCHCYEGYEEEARDPDECPRCYSNPCECDKIAEQKDRNRAAAFTCGDCGEHVKYCRCGRSDHDCDD
jgi:hypothetical protein